MRPINKQAALGMSFGPGQKPCPASERITDAKLRRQEATRASERALRGFALGRKSWLFAGSERGADRAAAMATLIMTAKLVEPLAWLADVLARIAGIPQGRLCELLPWNWSAHVRSVAPPQAA